MRPSTILALAALVALFIWAQRANRRALTPDDVVAGWAHAVDGDSIVMGTRRIRLEGIDAPEFQQTCRRHQLEYPCGREAHKALQTLLKQGEIRCDGTQEDRYGRLLATCMRGQQNLNAEMVRQGQAISYGDYLLEEAEARNQGRGIWDGEFIPPREWRETHPHRTDPAAKTHE